MIGTYASAALICAASLLVGRAILSLAGRRSWSWLEPGVGLAAMLRIWQVFPFDFPEGGFDWTLLARALLAVGIVGSVIGVVVALTTLARPGRRTSSASRGADS